MMCSYAFGISSKDFNIHIKGGVLLPGVFNPDGSSNYPASYKVGLEFESGRTTWFALQYGLVYSSYSYQSTSSADLDPLFQILQGVLGAQTVVTNEIHRLSIPLWFKFRFLQNSPFGFYIGPGLSLNLNIINGRIPETQGFSVGLGGLLGFQYHINDKIKIFVDFNYFLFSPIIVATPPTSFDYEFSILPGVAFTWGRNSKR